MAFKIKSDLSEVQVEADVSSYLGYITPMWAERYRLIAVDEQLTGSDKLFNRFRPIYIQFKVSHGLNPSTSILRYQNTPLSNIIDFRKKNDLLNNPILYFQLRKKAKTATDLQHNILYKLHNPPTQYSLYVAPLTLSASEYTKQLNGDGFMRFYPCDPFRNGILEIHDKNTGKNLFLSSNPFLRHHISITPHASASTHNHHYSYSKSGANLVWHGGEILNGDFRLSTQLLSILNNFYNNENTFMTKRGFIEYIEEFNKDNLIFDFNESKGNDSVEIIFNFANRLKEKFGINLMILTELKS